MNSARPIIIIPSLDPDDKLISIAAQLRKNDLQIVIVNDGSGILYDPIYEELKNKYQCEICLHKKNRGKGEALKTGIQYASVNFPESCGFVTADADGQHTPEDILKVVTALEEYPDSLILGTRNFQKKGIPLKSLLGNRLTSFIYYLSTGRKCADTQTGLRGIPSSLKALCLSVSGSQYEYEMNLLLEMGKMQVPFIFVPIETVYLNHNASSHFNPVRDSILIYFNILKYSLSSLVSAAADLSLFTLLVNFVFGTGSSGILASTAAARFISGSINFSLNKLWVFESNRHSIVEALEYLTLFLCQMMTSWYLVSGLSSLPINLTLLKVLVDTGLFFISYEIQKNIIFRKKEERKAISE